MPQSRLFLAREIVLSADVRPGITFPKCKSTSLDCKRAALWAVFALVAIAGPSCLAQTYLPFGLSNPQHKKLPVEEAKRIYFSACDHVARAIRPESPPLLRPKFVLVLGAPDDQTVREAGSSEVRLKGWNPASFAEAVVIMAAREILNTRDVTNLTRETLLSARGTVSVSELKDGQ